MNIVEYAEFIVKNIVKQPDLVKVTSFTGDEDTTIVEIIVCEDDMHMAEIFRELVTHNITFSKINLYYTTDLKQNSESLETTLTEFKLDPETNKYKAQNVELKLLN